MSARAATAAPPVALVFVRNTVSHDARVLREAETLRMLGYRVLVAGVVSSAETERRLELDGTEVVRLAPGAGVRRWLGRGPRGSARTAGPSLSPAGDAAGSRPSLAGRLRRSALTLAYYLGGIRLAWRVRPTLIHANDYNTMWIAVAAKILLGVPVVYDCHELWADRNGRPEWRAWLIACEALFVRVADVTITTSPGYAEAIAARYRVTAPRVVRNIPRAGAGAPGRNGSRTGPVAVYLGGVMPGRGLEQAIEALRLAPEVRLRVVGPGRDPYRASLQRAARAAGVEDRTEITGPVPLTDALESIAGCDMGVMLIQPVCRSYELTLPNKLFEYAAAGLPILSSDLPVIGQVVRSEGIGEVVAAEDVEQIARGMERLADPDVNARARDRIAAFAARESWENERAVLAGTYQELR